MFSIKLNVKMASICGLKHQSKQSWCHDSWLQYVHCTSVLANNSFCFCATKRLSSSTHLYPRMKLWDWIELVLAFGWWFVDVIRARPTEQPHGNSFVCCKGHPIFLTFLVGEKLLFDRNANDILKLLWCYTLYNCNQ